MSEQGIDLHGTRVLLTGGTSGLGLAMARALAMAGARVVLTSADRGPRAKRERPERERPERERPERAG